MNPRYFTFHAKNEQYDYIQFRHKHLVFILQPVSLEPAVKWHYFTGTRSHHAAID